MIAVLFACGATHLPEGAVAPRAGSHEEKVAELPEVGGFADWSTSWRDPERLLVRLTAYPQDTVVVADSAGVTVYCDGVEGLPGLARVRGTDDVGIWEVEDGVLHVLTDTFTRMSCGADGLSATATVPSELWAGAVVMTEGGFLAWPRGAAAPSRYGWDGTEQAIPFPGPSPYHVAPHRDASGLWALTAGSDAVTLWSIERDGTVLEVMSVPLEGASLLEAWNLDPEALIVATDGGYFAASQSLGGSFRAFDRGALSSGVTYRVWDEGHGFSGLGTGTSVNLEAGRTLDVGDATPDGRHLVLDGILGDRTVSELDNAADATVTATWRADLTTTYDWLGADADATYEGFGFENGVCGVARWGVTWGMQAKSGGYDEGDFAWYAADTLVSRGLQHELGILPLFGGPRKRDFPLFVLRNGVRINDEVDLIDEETANYDMAIDGYGVGADGEVVPLFSGADRYLPQRIGTQVWTLHGSELWRVDAAPWLEGGGR